MNGLARLIKRIPIKPSGRPGYFSFGYIPIGAIRTDLNARFLGIPILLKRLQAFDVMRALDLLPSERVLDFGCGGGYFTVEMAKLTREAVGIDVNPYLDSIIVPPMLQGRLRYVVTEGQGLPFPDGYFDKVLASEVLPMVPDPTVFLSEIRRVLRPGGRLVVTNGAGHPAIREAYVRSGWLLRALQRRYPERFPPTYEDYCRILQESFGTGQKRFLEKEDLRKLLEGSGFHLRSWDFSPGRLAGAYLSWSQFALYLRNGLTISQKNFPLNFLALSLLRIFERRRHEGGVICVAER